MQSSDQARIDKLRADIANKEKKIKKRQDKQRRDQRFIEDGIEEKNQKRL